MREYLLTYGVLGDLGRFRAPDGMAFGRGDRAVARTPRGVEIGEVLREAVSSRVQTVPILGEILRSAQGDDEQTATQRLAEADDLLAQAQSVAEALGAPLAILDAEMLLDGEHAILQVVRWGKYEISDLTSHLSRQSSVRIDVQDMTVAEESHGCGTCGSAEGGCGSESCGTGGCGSGGCGTVKPDELKDYFLGLRGKMQDRQRVALM